MSDGQKAKRADEKPKRQHVDDHVEEIAWLINDAPRELGVRGVTVDPSGGGGGTPADTWHLHERRYRAGNSVRRWRITIRAWRLLTTLDQNVLAAAYTSRQVLEVFGAEAAFKSVSLACVALVTEPDLPRLLEALRDQNNAKHSPAITAARKRAVMALGAAHGAWRAAWRSVLRGELEDDGGAATAP